MRYVVIMAGGSGTRLWPLSRKGTPKQLLKIVNGTSLLRLAFERALRLVPAERVVVVTGASYLDAVRDDLPELPEQNLLGEPIGRDSLNACAWPAAVLADRDPEAVIAQFTADQIIEPVDAFAASLDRAFALAEDQPDALVTLGVVPTEPHTGYGYLERGEPVPGFGDACVVTEFKEKPSLDVATDYVASGRYWWNAGMFVWRAASFLEEVRLLEPQTHAAITELAAEPGRLEEIFPALRKVSVDYAIMEPVSHGRGAGRVLSVGLPISWRDVGGFASLAEIVATDADGNAVEGLAVTVDAQHNLVFNAAGPGHLVGVAGISGAVVVVTPDATLVTTLDDAEKVKSLVGRIAESAPSFA